MTAQMSHRDATLIAESAAQRIASAAADGHAPSELDLACYRQARARLTMLSRAPEILESISPQQDGSAS